LLSISALGFSILADTHVGGAMTIWTAGSEKMRVFSDGNVGINTGATNAGYKLDVNGTGRFTSNLLAQKVQVGTAATINDATGVGNTLQFANYSAGVFVTGSADSYIYKTSSVFGGLSPQTLIFQTRSDVGGGGFAFVGGSTPSAVATISSTGVATFSSSVTANYISSIISSSSNASPLILQNTSGWGISQITSISVKDGSDVVGAIGWKYDGVANVDMLFHSLYNGAYKNTSNVVMTVKGTGNVGIGTISPVERLHVETSNEYQITWARTGAGKRWAIGTDTVGFYFNNRTDSVLPLFITNGGNVLIGTTTNGASKLRISGLPTSAVGLSSGDVYNMAGVLMIA
jgi:hypothetical protein